MAEQTEFVMPKLGLTMTEGRIARWVVAPGTRFAAGDVVVEIETDKIVNEVEAPSAGILIELIEPEGATVPVGAPLARWQPGDAGAVPAPKPTKSAEKQATAEEPARVPAATEPSRPPKPHAPSGRVLSTPYARKLAKQKGLEIATIEGTGPGGRIKAIDVDRAAAVVPALLPAAPRVDALGRSHSPAAQQPGRDLSLITIDVDVARLREIQLSVSKAGHESLDNRHYVALACVRALAALQGFSDTVPVGFAVDAPAGPSLLTLHAPPRITLLALASETADLERRAGQDRLRREDTAGGHMLILAGGNSTRVFGPAVPPGWATAIGIGSVREVFRPGADGSPLLGHEMTLALSYAASELPHGEALDLLASIKALLEAPLSMLV